MITLKKKLQQKKDHIPDNRVSIRDKLLVQDVRSLAFALVCSVFCLSEVQEMEQHTPHTCMVHFDDPNKLHQFTLTITPDTGYWCGGKFVFSIEVLEDYNILVSLICGILWAS
ncbi:hypothetical protein NP493_239g11016 [Ridgeia piscesae]|uniref:Uncharacterized protein n=1 Tax=Ridgeia piscesae TaxID=27915 RepID=A0AAD9NZL4_RIDPI|nr:hypothetical protein NP493_239g11016 [Ridgeia piscesae]